MQPETAALEEQEARLAGVLAEVTAALRQGGWPDLDALAAKHPDLADELRSLWPAILVAEEAAKPSEDHDVTRSEARGAGDHEHVSPARRFGDYELLEELGRGGMGVVYKAHQRSLDRVVALKMILHGDVASASDRDRFKAEAEAAARLDHSGIVPVYETGEHEGRPYFSMKFVEGTTLAALAARGPLPPEQAVRYALAVARAVHHAHQAGILHRDLKPSNVLIDRNDQAHVTDFGLAKRVPMELSPETTAQLPRSLTQTGAILGTPGFMPPEQAAGRRGHLGPASDTYSIGAILYHLLTGRPPFQAATAMDTLLLVLEQDPIPLRLLNPRVDRDLELICLKCLQKPMDLRYQSAQELADDLQAYLEGQPLSVRPSSMLQVMVRMLRPTHHAAILENWGKLWIAHSIAVVIQCGITAWMAYVDVTSRIPYLLLWGAALLVWAAIFWHLRKRAGPVTFVERQVAHVWGGAVITSIFLFLIEMLLTPPLPVLTLSPVLALVAGMMFMSKAGMLTGAFYVQSAICFGTALIMTLLPRYVGIALFGVVLAGSFFVPGWKYYHVRLQSAPEPQRGGSQ